MPANLNSDSEAAILTREMYREILLAKKCIIKDDDIRMC